MQQNSSVPPPPARRAIDDQGLDVYDVARTDRRLRPPRKSGTPPTAEGLMNGRTEGSKMTAPTIKPVRTR